MPVFEFTSRDHEGRVVKGTLDAPDRTSAVLELRDRGILTTDVHPVGPTAAEQAATEERRAGFFRRHFIDPIFFRVSYRRLAWLFRELASLTRSGVSLLEALDLTSRDLRPPRLRQALRDIHGQVLRGRPMSEAMGKYPTLFNELMVALVAAGERSGHIPEMFTAIAEWLEYEVSIRTKMFTATLYPKFVAVVALSLVVVIANVNLIMEGKAALLPLLCVGTAVALVGGWFLYKGGERLLEQVASWRRSWDSIKASMPVIGNMMRKFALARFCTVLGTMYRAGLLLPTAVGIAADACGNAYLRDRIRTAVPVLYEGNGLAETLTHTGVFPANVLHMIATGEQTGDLDTLMENVARHMTEEADATAQRMVPVLFIVTFLILAVFIGIFVVGWYVNFINGQIDRADL